MKPIMLAVMLLAHFGARAAEQQSEFAIGRAYYAEGEFRKAATHFQVALITSPGDAESHYWVGMSYQGMADIATPFGGKYNSKARFYLTKAVELAPSRPDYRRALLDFLIDSADTSGSALKQAAEMLRALPEDDPDSRHMRRRLEHQGKVNSSADARLGRLFLLGPRAVNRIAELPASALSNARAAALRTPSQP
jgi:tetratricopeptide (TPR) repeat protein